MKTVNPSIRFQLKKSKSNALGEHPIVCTISYYGRVEKATSIYILPKYWDASTQRVKKSCPNSLTINKQLNSTLNKVLDRVDKYLKNGEKFTVKMLASDDEITPYNSRRYKDIQGRMVKERGLSIGTIRNYLTTFNTLSHHFGNEEFLIDDINLGVLKSIGDEYKKKGYKDGSLLKFYKNVHAVWSYARDNRMVIDNPFKGIRMRVLEKSGRLYFLEPIHVQMMMKAFISMVADVKEDGGWTYKEGAFERLRVRSSVEFSLGFFLVLLKMNGSAPIDAALLRLDAIEEKLINGDMYYCINLKRKKTNMAVNIRCKKDMLSTILLSHYMGSSRNGYLYPIMRGDEDGDRAIALSMQHFTRVGIDKLRKVCERLNEAIYELNSKGGTIPWIDAKKVVYYTARHTFATAYLSSPNASLRGLASLMGRGIESIGTYVHMLGRDEEIVENISQLPF